MVHLHMSLPLPCSMVNDQMVRVAIGVERASLTHPAEHSNQLLSVLLTVPLLLAVQLPRCRCPSFLNLNRPLNFRSLIQTASLVGILCRRIKLVQVHTSLLSHCHSHARWSQLSQSLSLSLIKWSGSDRRGGESFLNPSCKM